jgi:hypothetical protein
VARGDINTANLLTLISVGILVGTEIFGVALAAGWAIAGLFDLGQTIGYVLMAVFGVVGAYALFRFMRRAATFEPLRQ